MFGMATAKCLRGTLKIVGFPMHFVREYETVLGLYDDQ